MFCSRLVYISTFSVTVSFRKVVAYLLVPLLEIDSVILCYYTRVFNLNGTASNPIVFMDEFPQRGKETHDSFTVVHYHLYAR